MIKKIRLQGLLSFEDMELELRNLNVLIGPNGSGKSNLIEALSLLQALPTDIGEPIRRGGGIGEWLRKSGNESKVAVIRAETESDELVLRYQVRLEAVGPRHSIAEESLTASDIEHPIFQFDNGKGSIVRFDHFDKQSTVYDVVALQLQDTSHSALQELRNPATFPLSRMLSDNLVGIRLFRNWNFGQNATPRQHQHADYDPSFLMEGAENLALVVNEFDNMRIKEDVEAELRRFYNRCERLSVSIFGNQLILNMHEEGLDKPIPATRWSDGMIRYLCLLAILCHPNPPGLICIDEPDLGFHPDVLPNLARLIKSASERMQIIITTHSAELVDQFTDEPESIVVCERDFDGATQMKRQDPKRLKKWLEDYELGDLWRRGEIGGNPL